jgi:hypothetical protein
MKALLEKYWNKIQEFFFAPRSLYQLGLMRMIVASALFFLYCWRQVEVKFYYTDTQGVVLKDQALSLMPDFYQPLFTVFVWPDAWVPWIHGLLVFALGGLALGVGGRLWTLATWLLSLGFLQRNYFVAYGADLIGTMWLFYLSWTRHNAYFSILNYFKKDRLASITCDLFSSAGARMIQLHLCIIYGYTGLQKLKGSSWWDGTSLWTVWGNQQFTVVDMAWTSHWPLLIAGGVFSTLLFEVYFPVLVWRRNLRPWVLFFGGCFHLGIALTMGIWSFAAIMVSSYVLFFDESFRLNSWFKQWTKRLNVSK